MAKQTSLRNLLFFTTIFTVIPCVLLVLDAIRQVQHDSSIALHIFLLLIFGPIAITTIAVGIYTIVRRK